MKCYGSTLSFLLFSSDFIYRYVPSSWTYCHPVRGVCSNSSSPCDSWSLRVQCIRGGGKSKTCENWLVLFLRLFYKKIMTLNIPQSHLSSTRMPCDCHWSIWGRFFNFFIKLCEVCRIFRNGWHMDTVYICWKAIEIQERQCYPPLLLF